MWRTVGLCLVGAALVITVSWAAFGEGIGSDAAAIEKARRQGQQTKAGQQGTPIVPAQQQEPDAWDHNDPCQNPPAREEADLCQQWRMAQATEELRATADAQYSWTIIQSGLLAVTFAATAVAAWAAVYAARAAQASIKVAREFGAIELRSYVSVASCRIDDLTIGKIPQITVEIRNAGQTPAHGLRMGTHINIGPPETAVRIIFGRAAGKKKSLATLGASGELKSVNSCEFVVTQDIMKKFNAGEAVIIIGIYIKYLDVFKKTRRTISKLLLDTSSLHEGRGAFRTCEKGNRST